MIKCYEEIIKRQNKKVINIAGKQGQLLKMFKDAEQLFETVGQRESNIYFKINLYMF